MERSLADEGLAADVALAGLPSTSGAHWAHRDERRGGQSTPFRRPNALRAPAADESAGADPQTRRALRAALRRRARDGAAILYTTHYLPELVERHGGRVVVVPGDPRAFKITAALDLALAAIIAEDAGAGPR